MNRCWICGSDCYEDLTCTKCGPSEPWGPVAADFERIFGDDKTERELSHPRYIETFLEEDDER